MNKKHEAVKDMGTGEIVDILLHGGEPLYYKEKQVALTNQYSQVVERVDRFMFDVMSLARAIETGEITRLVDVQWTEQLDGTWVNGVWCMCWDENSLGYTKVLKIVSKSKHWFSDARDDRMENAKPLPEDQAEKMEALSKGVEA